MVGPDGRLARGPVVGEAPVAAQVDQDHVAGRGVRDDVLGLGADVPVPARDRVRPQVGLCAPGEGRHGSDRCRGGQGAPEPGAQQAARACHPNRSGHDRNREQESRGALVQERVLVQRREDQHLGPQHGQGDGRRGPAQPVDGDQPGHEQQGGQPQRPEADVAPHVFEPVGYERDTGLPALAGGQVEVAEVGRVSEPGQDRPGVERLVDNRHEDGRHRAGHRGLGQPPPGAAGQLDAGHRRERRDADEGDGVAEQHAAPHGHRQAASPPARPVALEPDGHGQREQRQAGIGGVLLEVVAGEQAGNQQHARPRPAARPRPGRPALASRSPARASRPRPRPPRRRPAAAAARPASRRR